MARRATPWCSIEKERMWLIGGRPSYCKMRGDLPIPYHGNFDIVVMLTRKIVSTLVIFIRSLAFSPWSFSSHVVTVTSWVRTQITKKIIAIGTCLQSGQNSDLLRILKRKWLRAELIKRPFLYFTRLNWRLEYKRIQVLANETYSTVGLVFFEQGMEEKNSII